MNFVAPAGSNVAYIGLIITGVDVTPCISYHTIYEKIKVKFKYIHDVDKKIDKEDIKIYFDHMKEIIPLNWYTKFILKPATEFDKTAGVQWIESQSGAWKETHSDRWMARAALRWIYNLNTQGLGLGDLDQKKHFDGTCLYEGYEMSRSQFAKFGVTYYEHQYQQWLESQVDVIDMITSIVQCDSMTKVHSFNDDFSRGIALGSLARKRSLTEESAWQQYIK